MRHLYSPVKKSPGFTLIELMIAISVSVILLNGVLQIFQNSKKSYRIADNIGRVQENARYALNVLAQDIRQAGYLPCRIQSNANGDPKISNVLNDTTGGYDFFNFPIIGFEGNSSLFPAEFNAEGTAFGTRLAGSDGIRILRGDNRTLSVADTSGATTRTTSQTGLSPGDIILICSVTSPEQEASATILQVTNPTAPNTNVIVRNTGNSVIPGNCTLNIRAFPTPCPGPPNPDPGQQFPPGSQITKFSSYIYYIGASLATDGDALPTNSLYRGELLPDGSFSNDELVQGIETMQIIYGVALDPNSSAVRYVTANNVNAGEWNNVVSVRIGMLLHSPEEISTAVDSTSYNVVGTTITSSSAIAYPADRRQRYVFSETINLRNRGLAVAPPSE